MTEGILIADAGSSKTDWAFIPGNGLAPLCFNSSGLNPVLLSEIEFKDILNKVNADLKDNYRVSDIYFYGAGISTDSIKINLKALFFEIWPLAKIHLYSDLLGAAKALFKNNKGIACILGTGSNSCLYEKGKIISQVPSLGFILGDEGSGSALGKTFLNGIYKGWLPPHIISRFHEEYKLSLTDIIENTYKSSKPSAFLASFAPFIFRNLHEESIFELVKGIFSSFFQKNVSLYENYASYELGFVGSIAYEFSNIIIDVASSWNLKIKRILKTPIEGLINYHINALE